jgi:hypothetical protein
MRVFLEDVLMEFVCTRVRRAYSRSAASVQTWISSSTTHFFGGADIPPDHDHLLVFKHGAGGAPSLAFSCVGDELKPTIAAVRAAVAAGRCSAESGPVETC